MFVDIAIVPTDSPILWLLPRKPRVFHPLLLSFYQNNPGKPVKVALGHYSPRGRRILPTLVIYLLGCLLTHRMSRAG